MKVKVLKPSIVDVKYLKVRIDNIDIRDWELNYNPIESMEQHPFYSNKKSIEFAIELETGKVLNWCQGNRLETWDKVVDEGVYTLCDSDFNEVVGYDGYVPKMLDRRGDGYGDYLQFIIDENGYILNWEVSFKEFDCEWVS